MEALGQLAGGVAHDFNNLLTAIMSHAAFLLESLPNSDERRVDAEGVVQAAERAAGLTRQLLAFSRRQPVKLRPLDLNRSVTEIKTLLQRTLGGGIALELATSQSPAVVLADCTKIDQVLLNLAVNARDAMPNGGTLSIVVSRPPSECLEHEGWVELSVTDTGVGMAESVLRAIFLPFFSTKAPGKGTGLGLATCYGIVKQLKGEIQVKSQPGQGTTFTILLPSHPEQNLREEVAPEVSAPAAPAGVTILLVEDERPIRETSRRVLESAGYRVIMAEDGAAADHLLDQHAKELDLVISDIVLPVGNGFEVVNRAAQLYPQAALLLTSGWVESMPDSESANPAGRTEILPKPYSNQDLLEAVRRALAAATKKKQPQTTNRQEHRILVVDDDPAILSLLQRALTRKGYPVVAADGVQAARRALTEDSTFSAVLCDHNLGDGMGANLLQWLADHNPLLARKAFLLTGEDAVDVPQCLDFLKGQIIGKPFCMSELLRRLDQLIL